jgi:phosphohistidine phosphatase
MKSLFIVRHAKSSWKDPRLMDHQRPLNKRGKKAAPKMGKRMKKKCVRPDAIVTSDARRALDTADLLVHAMGLPSEVIRLNPELYHAPPDGILDIVHHFPDEWNQVMVVGHNPGLTELANWFYPDYIENIPTAGIVKLRFETNAWDRIDQDKLIHSFFDYPKKHDR